MRVFNVFSILLIITSIFLTGCGGGGSTSAAGGSTSKVTLNTVPLKLKMSIVKHPYGAPSKAPKMSATTLEELENSGKMGILIWDISSTSTSSSSAMAPSVKNLSPKMNSSSIDLNIPAYNQVFSDGITNFKFMGGTFVDYSSHSATVDVLPGSKLAVFSFALLNKYDSVDQTYSWEPAYVGVDIVDVTQGSSSSKSLSLYEGDEITSSQLSAAGLDPNLNYRIAMNPSILGELPDAMGMFAYNPQAGETPQIIFNIGDQIAGKLQMDYPPIISSDYYYTIQFSISKTGSSTTYSNTVYLRPNSTYTKLAAYDTNNNPLTDFTVSTDNTSVYFNPSSSYGGYLNSNGTIAKSGIYMFDFSMISNHDTEASQFMYYINVPDPNQQSINPSLAFTQVNQGVFPPDANHLNYYVSTANGSELFRYSDSNTITFRSGKAIDLGGQPTTPPTIASVYSDPSAQDTFTVNPMNYYAYVCPLSSDPANDQTIAPEIMVSTYDSLNGILYFTLLPGVDTTHTTTNSPPTITLDSTNNAYFPPTMTTPGYAADENTNTIWDLVYSSGELWANTHLNQNTIQDLGTTDPSSNIPSVSSVYSSGSAVVYPVAGHYYAYVPYASSAPTTDSQAAPIIKVTQIDTNNNNMTFEVMSVYMPSSNPPAFGSILATYEITTTCTQPTGITYNPNNGHYWIADRVSNKIEDYDPITQTFGASLSPSWFANISWQGGLDYYGNYLWAVNGDNGNVSVTKFDPTTGASIETISLSSLTDSNSNSYSLTFPTGIFVNASWIVIVDNSAKKIYILDKNTYMVLNIINTSSFGCTNPWGITYDGSQFYVSDGVDDKIFIIDSTGSLLDSFNAPPSPGSSNPAPKGLGVAPDGLLILDSPTTNVSTIFKVANQQYPL